MPATELRDKRVDGANLDTLAATRVAQPSGLDMVDSVGNEERQRTEALDDRVACLRSRETLQQFLQHEPVREDPSPDSSASRRRSTAASAGLASRRNASDHTLVSMKRSTQRVRSAL